MAESGRKSKRSKSKRRMDDAGSTIAVPSPFADSGVAVGSPGPWEMQAESGMGYPVDPQFAPSAPPAPYLDPNGDPLDVPPDYFNSGKGYEKEYEQPDYSPAGQVHYAGHGGSSSSSSSSSMYAAPFPGGRGGGGGSNTYVVDGSMPPVNPDDHVCPACTLQWVDPLPALVLECPRCSHKYCFFCSMLLRDGLPCVKKICRRQRKIMWSEEDEAWKQQQVAQPKEKTGKKVKRKAKSVAYGAGVAACATTSGLLVAAGIAGVPFTAGFSLILLPIAVVPYQGAKETYTRRKRWVVNEKDKRRQSTRSQIHLDSMSSIDRDPNTLGARGRSQTTPSLFQHEVGAQPAPTAPVYPPHAASAASVYPPSAAATAAAYPPSYYVDPGRGRSNTSR